MGSSAKSRKKWCERISCLVIGVFAIGLCVSSFSSEKTYSTGGRKIGIKSFSQIPQGHVAPHKNSAKKEPHREASFKSVNLVSAVRAHQNCGEDTRRNLAPRNMRPQSSMRLGQKCLSDQNTDKATFYSPIEARATQRNENSWLTLEHQCTC